MAAMRLYEYEDAYVQAQELCGRIVEILKEDIAQRGRALLLVPGGSSPKKLFEALKASNLSWDKITLSLTDERCVPCESADCNAKMIERALGVKPVQLWDDVKGVMCEKDAQSHIWPASAIILGMGPDGHFASLFPHQVMQGETMLIEGVAPQEPQKRVSYTLPQLLGTKNLFLLVNGLEKRAVYERALQGDESLPITHLIRAAGDKLNIYICD